MSDERAHSVILPGRESAPHCRVLDSSGGPSKRMSIEVDTWTNGKDGQFKLTPFCANTYADSANWHADWKYIAQRPTGTAHHEVAGQVVNKERAMNPIAAGVAGALISGVAMYAVGTKAAPQMDTFAQEPALVHTVDGQFVPAGYTNSLRPVASPSVATATPVRSARRTTTARPAYRAPVQEREVVRDQREVVREDDRSWGKTAMIVGGSAAGGAGVGGVVGGKKGALIGAAIGGGAASIYEAIQRR